MSCWLHRRSKTLESQIQHLYRFFSHKPFHSSFHSSLMFSVFFFNTMCIVHFEAWSLSIECIKHFHVCVGVHCPLYIIQCLQCLLLGLTVGFVHCDSFISCESWKVGNQYSDDKPQA
jgi:hypothetical protein